MYYEFNVAQSGCHLFATAKRSVTSSSEAERLARLFKKKFPESQGYSITISYYPERGYATDVSSFLDDTSQLFKEAYK
jgi:hypothetical protein